jgi:hypothetical protein
MTLFFSKTLKTTITRKKQQRGKKQLKHSTYKNFSNPLVALFHLCLDSSLSDELNTDHIAMSLYCMPLGL